MDCISQSIDSIQVDKIWRKYEIYKPTNYSGTEPLPVVFYLHGSKREMNVNSHWNTSGKIYQSWRRLAETENFIAVFPFSGHYNYVDTTLKAALWNSGASIEQEIDFSDPLDDENFILTLADKIRGYNVTDTCRFFISGFSNGAGMTHRIALNHGSRFSAFFAASGLCQTTRTNMNSRNIPGLVSFGNRDKYFYEPFLEAGLISDSILPMDGQLVFKDSISPLKPILNKFALSQGNLLSATIVKEIPRKKIIKASFLGGSPYIVNLTYNVGHEWKTKGPTNHTKQAWNFFNRNSSCP